VEPQYRRKKVEANLVFSMRNGEGLRSSKIVSDGLYPQSKKSDTSVRNLALAILLQAFRDVIAPRKSSNKEWALWRRDAIEWFFAEDADPGSFHWVCEVLQMSSTDLRGWIRAYKRSGRTHRKEMVRRLIRFQIPH
jgi:hypothetical protein